MSHWQYSSTTHLNQQQQNPYRYSAGIALVLLLHVGAIIAFKSGLNIRDFINDIPPSNVHVIVPPPPTTIDPVTKTTVNLWNPQTGGATEKPKPFDIITKTTPDDPPPIDTKATPATNAEPVIVMAKTDPRHPLTQPAYPAQSRRLGEQGSVELLIYVLADGRVGDARIAVSSGFPRLDQAALQEALRTWKLLPNQVDGVAVASWNRIGITFRLKN